MPDMDGLEVARGISRDPALAGTGLVLLTSDSEDHTEEARAAGIAARLSKPVHLAQLHNDAQPPSWEPPHASGRRRGRSAARHRPAATSWSSRTTRSTSWSPPGILEHLGYTCDVADNGVEALAALAGTPYDAVLMDCQMPEMDGYQATLELRRRERADAGTPDHRHDRGRHAPRSGSGAWRPAWTTSSPSRSIRVPSTRP